MKIYWPLFASLTLAAPTAGAKLNVVATTPDLAAIAREVGGDVVEITTLAKPTEDPHFVDARPSFIVKLNRADALIEGGAELEAGWLQPLLSGSRNPKIAVGAPGRIVCAQGVTLLEVPTALDRSKGDIHASGNPHYMTDPENAKIVAKHICEAFCRLDNKLCDRFQANLQKLSRRFEQKEAEWQRMLAPSAGKSIVSYHNMWPYFARHFRLKADLFLEPKPGIPPTPTHLAGVIARMKAEQIRVVIVEPFQNRRTAEKVAAETGAVVVDVTQYPGGVKGTEGGYIELMDYLVRSLARALEQVPQ
ncbi:MAG TPA: metal ABC transporter substrate-binding protein [Verrucomicrobiae bacterium]|nr:metal ABC transporter substrate-binding protein [Verrucomicrobiae bacterium]